MSIKNWVFGVVVAALLSACGEGNKSPLVSMTGDELQVFLSQQDLTEWNPLSFVFWPIPRTSGVPYSREQYDDRYWYSPYYQDSFYGSGDGSKILISEIDPSNGTANIVGKIEALVHSSENLYLLQSDSTTEAVVSVGRAQYSGNPFDTAKDSTGVSVVNVQNVDSPQIMWNMGIEGRFISSYKTGDTLHLITKRKIGDDRPAFVHSGDSIYGEITENIAGPLDLRSKYIYDGRVLPLSKPCFREASSSDYMQFINITSINLRDSSVSSVCLLGKGFQFSGISSDTAFIIGSELGLLSDTTHIHAFKLGEEGVKYSASNTVLGLVEGSPDHISVEGDTVRLIVREKEKGFKLFSFQRQGNELRRIDDLPNDNVVAEDHLSIASVAFSNKLAVIQTHEGSTEREGRLINFSGTPKIEIFSESDQGFESYILPVGKHFLFTLSWSQASLLDLSTSPPTLLNSIDLEIRKTSLAFFGLDLFEPNIFQASDDQIRIVLESTVGYDPTGLAMLEINGLTTENPELINVGQIDAPSRFGLSLILGESVFYSYGSALWATPWGEPESTQGPMLMPSCEGDETPSLEVTLKYTGETPPEDLCQWGVTAFIEASSSTGVLFGVKELLIPNLAMSSPSECHFEGLVQRLPRAYDILVNSGEDYLVTNISDGKQLQTKGTYCEAEPIALTLYVEPKDKP